MPPYVFEITVMPAGNRFAAAANQTLLQAAELAQLAEEVKGIKEIKGVKGTNKPAFQLASSCRNGTCRTCICQLVSGEVVYQIDWPGLSRDEKSAGLILPCVAYPLSDLVIGPAV